jgi:hypothetical protein
MNRTTSLIVGVLLVAAPLLALAQVQNEGLANQIIAARQKNTALMMQYNWNCRTEFIENGNVKDMRIDAVAYGPDGEIHHSVLNEQKAPMPHGFFARAAADDERKKIDKYLTGLHRLLNQYSLKSDGAVINFLSQAAIQTGQDPDGTPTLSMTGNSVIVPGDTILLTVNPTNFQPLRMEISTTYEGHQATGSATCKTMKSGLTHLQFATITIPDKNILLQVHNYDYAPND